MGIPENIARIMVRKYLRSLLATGVEEDTLITFFEDVLEKNPTLPMKDAALAVEKKVRRV